MDTSVPINEAQKELLVIEAIRKESLRGLFIFLVVALVFLFLRILLNLIGANPENIFMGFITLISGIFLLPFFGILPQSEDVLPGQSSVDGAAFLAIFCYLVLVLLAMFIVQLGTKILKTGKLINKTIERDQTIETSIIDKSIE